MDVFPNTNTAWASIPRLLNEFRRHYHRARSVFVKLPNNGGVTFNVKGDAESGKVEAKSEIPEEEVAVQFALLMRRFLTPSSELYLHDVWKKLADYYGAQLREEERREIGESLSQLTHGPFNLIINSRAVHAADVYKLMSEGHVFGNNEEARKKLESSAQNPILGALFSFQFSDYNRTALGIASRIFEVISTLAKTGVLILSPMVESPQCIYCRSTTGPFESEEHIVPEAFGSHDAVLHRGVVCDHCNNRTLSELDHFLSNFEPLAFLRVYFTPHTKAGNYTHAEFQNLSMSRQGPRWIHCTPKDKSGEMCNLRELGDGRISWTQSIRGKVLDRILLGRALYKVALGHVAYEQGLVCALDERYETARDFIRGESLFRNNLIVLSEVTPWHGFKLQHQNFSPGTACYVCIFGLVFFFNLEEEPVFQLNEELRNRGFIEFDLSRAPTHREG